MTLLAFTAERCRLLSINISWPRGAQQQTHSTPLLLSIDVTDGRTDRQTGAQPFHKPSFAYYALQAVTMN